jgi:N-acylglucosamine 2-epimerase
MKADRIEHLIRVYRDGILGDSLPFWIEHALDRDYGGFVFCLDRDGTVIDTDKGVSQQAQFTWLLSYLHDLAPQPEWLEFARHGIEFLRRHAFDSEGRPYFQLTRDGKPLRRRHCFEAEACAAAAFAAWARASGDQEAADRARALFRSMARQAEDPSPAPPGIDAGTRPMKSIATPMLMLSSAQILRGTIGDEEAGPWVDRAIAEIERDFLKPEIECVMDTVGPKGELIDHFDGRTLQPGRALEAAWFVLAEAAHRGDDPDLVRLGTKMIDWTWARGWDTEYGGIYAQRDVRDLPLPQPGHDMKLWWVHTEAITATLMAWRLTADQKYARWHQHVHDWSYRHFADPEFGEWYGYLHRDGRPCVQPKGDLSKGAFHLPRMQLVCWKLLEGARAGVAPPDTPTLPSAGARP